MSESGYVMGHTDHERRRLALQASILAPYTELLLLQSGVSAGMHVLDLGCGVGDVSLIAARIAGPHGRVTGLDIDPIALDIARGRARDEGFEHAQFIQADLADYVPSGEFDAIVARHVLIHTHDVVGLLRRASSGLRPGGVLVCQEYDLSCHVPSWPPLPLSRRIAQGFVDFFVRATPHGNSGMRLFRWFLDAGFPPPELRAQVLMDGGPDSPYYEWLAETYRSLQPRLEQFGLFAPGEIDPDGLTQRIRDEALAAGAPATVIPLIGAFARKSPH